MANNKGNTALHEAVLERRALVVELLLLHGASVQALNKRQRTALDCAEQVVPSCVATLDDVGETDHKEYVTVKIRKKWNSNMYDLPNETFTRQFYFVHPVGQLNFRGQSSAESMARDRSAPDFTEEAGVPRDPLKQKKLLDQRQAETTEQGRGGTMVRRGAPGNRRMLRRHTLNEAVAKGLGDPREAGSSQS